MWRFSTSPITYEPGWRATPRWALRVLVTYAIAALAGGLLFVICAGLFAFFSPRETPTHPTAPIETAPGSVAPPDPVIETLPLVARARESLQLISIACSAPADQPAPQ